MDEVDIDNMEELNELEARLYAQIHHETTNEIGQIFSANASNGDVIPSYELSSNTARNLSKRYWTSTEYDGSQRWRGQPHYSQQLLIRNPFKIPNKEKQRRVNEQIKDRGTSAKKVLNPFKKQMKSPVQKNNEINTGTSSPSQTIKNINTNILIAMQEQPTAESDLKLNPIADWMKRKKNHVNKKLYEKNSSIDIKERHFFRQQLKLEKAKRIEEKKKKSKKAKRIVANKLKPSEIIDLDSDNESNSSDVIVIPIAPTPTFTVDDSADEDETTKVNITMEHEENAVDSTDVQLSSTTASFIKPKEICSQLLITVDNDEKRLDNSSRCTSPCSIQSSDDFIRNIDRVRLLAGGRGVADDEDLLELTSDMNILAESSDISKQTEHDNVCLQKNKDQLNFQQQELQKENGENCDTLEFATPERTKAQSRDYRVDQSQFRALDVYESESDITDSVYSKGVSKSTVIRQIDSSSDDIEDLNTIRQRTKRLRKRRASGSNKESDQNNEHLSSSSENENIEDDNKVLRTPVPYIAKGPAVERYKPQKRNRTFSSCSYLQNSKSPKTTAAGDNISDREFLATLNNLAHGQDEDPETQNLEESGESESENVPTAREMAEKILSQHSSKGKSSEAFTDDMALPNGILDDLDKVFETIDQLDRPNTQNLPTSDNTVQISESSDSDSDSDKNFYYPSVPNEDAQIIKYSPKNSVPKTHDENGSPIYNVIYIRGLRKPGGIAWSDEMRKFYNDSWNGEHFILRKVQQKMSPEKNLWKIYTEDRFNIKSNKRSNIKCTNCCELGHRRSKCKRPIKPLICYMCGESGHYEPRCPNTVCLRCGNKTQVFTKSCNACSFQNRLTCPICKIRGHSLEYCPDKWRRYHSTTEANVQPNNKVYYNPRKYCCVCGARGHISDFCRSALRFLEYPAISSSIKSHQKSYSDVVVKAPYNSIALNLMYEPSQEFKFHLVEQTSVDKYYGRFLKAVGLEFLMRRKRYSRPVPSESSESSAKKVKRLPKKYEVSTANRRNNKSMENVPNQVQEITESGNIDEYNDENQPEEVEVVTIEDKSENEVEVNDSDEEEDTCNIQLNTINEKYAGVKSKDVNFKSPKKVTKALSEKASKPQIEHSLQLDSDSNYSFSEHFDVGSISGRDESFTLESQTTGTLSNSQEIDEERLVANISRSKPLEMDTLLDFIPLVDSTDDQYDSNKEFDNFNVGISRKFKAAELNDEDDVEEDCRNLRPLSELPCEAKIYLTHFHTKYLLSAEGNTFLIETSRAHKLKARLDFTSVGYVLVIFGLISNQDKFQRELLLKYRDLEEQKNQRLVQSSINVPKRTFVLIKFLRENITQLMNNLGNANHLLNRLQYLERQQTKSGLKLAEKVRKSLNMILVGQAGLQDGTMHLDKLLTSLKTLLNDVTDVVAPPTLRSEITDHWKVIFSAYRHDNYQKLVEIYNKLASKNRIPQLNIDPSLLGQKVLDISLTEEQKQKLEQPRMQVPTSTELSKEILANPFSQKNAKNSKSKQNTETVNASKLPITNTTPNTNKSKATTLRADNGSSSLDIKIKEISNSTSILQNTTTSVSALSPAKTSLSSLSSRPTSTTINEASKKQTQKAIGLPLFPNSEKHSALSTAVQEVTDNWKSTCDTLLTEISSEKNTDKNLSGRVQDSKIPSTFWSRESMRYLDDCIRLTAARFEIVKKLERVQNKSKNGQLSYNDYLAVIKLHTTLNGK